MTGSSKELPQRLPDIDQRKTRYGWDQSICSREDFSQEILLLYTYFYLNLLTGSPKRESGNVARVRFWVSNLVPLTFMTTRSQREWSCSKASNREGIAVKGRSAVVDPLPKSEMAPCFNSDL